MTTTPPRFDADSATSREAAGRSGPSPGESGRTRRRTFLITAAITGPLALLLLGPWSMTATPTLSLPLEARTQLQASDRSVKPQTVRPATETIVPEAADETVAPRLTESERYAAQLVGLWDDEFYGKRRFEFRSDETATMTIELDSVGKLLYGPKLTFFIRWQVEGNELSLEMTGGEPAETAKTVARIFGESSRQRIESISPGELRLRSLDSGNLYTHRRVQ